MKVLFSLFTSLALVAVSAGQSVPTPANLLVSAPPPRPYFIPLPVNQVSNGVVAIAPLIPFPIVFGHNITFGFDQTITNGVGTINTVFGVDTSLGGINWLTNAFTVTAAAPSSINATVGSVVTVSNVNAFYARLSSVTSTYTNTVNFSNLVYYPWL